VSTRRASASPVTFAALFGVGATRSAVTEDSPVVGGVEMLGLGLVVAAVAYYAGTVVAWLLA
jgi:VIT1/CCC1 family predicted Fe2+/Mn2+ transporter